MAKKANPFDNAFSAFQQSLSDLRFEVVLAGTAEKLLTENTQRIMDAVSKAAIRKETRLAGSALIGRHPTRDDGTWILHGRTHATAQDFSRVTHQMVRGLNARLVAAAFEVTEDFFRNTAGVFLYQARNGIRITLASRESFEKCNAKMRQKRGDKGYLQAYAEFVARRNCDRLLKMFDKHVAGFGDSSRALRDGIDLFEFFRALGICRHAVAHNNCVLADDAIAELGPQNERFLRAIADTAAFGDSPPLRVQPDKESAMSVLRLLVEFGTLLYTRLAEQFDMRTDLIVEL